jgi:hypothetical protein
MLTSNGPRLIVYRIILLSFTIEQKIKYRLASISVGQANFADFVGRAVCQCPILFKIS